MRIRLMIAGALSVLLVAGLPTAQAVSSFSDSASDASWVEQVGTYTYLTAPNYSGLGPISTVLSPAALGLGTFDALDGELMILRGVPYRVGIDGVPRAVSRDLISPFVQAIAFKPDASDSVAPGTTCAALVTAIDTLAQPDVGVVGVRVRGTFTDLVTRSVPAQAKPYKPLAEVVANQTVFQLGQKRAVLMGFRTGNDLAGTGAPGLHLHGLTADKSAGGHVLSCVAGNDVQLSVQRAAGAQISSAK